MSKLKEEFEIRYWQDGEYAVYRKGDIEGITLFIGTIEEVNAWISLREKGYNI